MLLESLKGREGEGMFEEMMDKKFPNYENYIPTYQSEQKAQET